MERVGDARVEYTDWSDEIDRARDEMDHQDESIFSRAAHFFQLNPGDRNWDTVELEIKVINSDIDKYNGVTLIAAAVFVLAVAVQSLFFTFLGGIFASVLIMKNLNRKGDLEGKVQRLIDRNSRWIQGGDFQFASLFVTRLSVRSSDS